MEERSQVSVNSQTALTVPSANRSDRVARISATLIDIFEDLSGAKISSADSSVSFLEMGFDSLFLTQVTQALQSKFGLKITFRQLLGEQSTFKTLSEYIHAALPPDALAEKETPAKIVERIPEGVEHSVSVHAGNPVTSVGTSDSPVERLMREQLDAMNQLFASQLQALRAAQRERVHSPFTPSANLPGAPVLTPPSKSSMPPSAIVEQKEFKPFGPYKPPQKSAGELTAQQQKYLQAFISRYTKRTSKSKSMTQQHRFPLADPRVVSGFRLPWKEIVYPIHTVRSKGSRLWDIDGNEYIDVLNGFGPIMLGHRPGFIAQAIQRQLHEGFEIGPQTPLAGEIAQMFCEMTGNERMTFCNTGSEAVIAALRVARTVTGRSKVVLFSGAYHGMFDEVLVKGLKGAAFDRAYVDHEVAYHQAVLDAVDKTLIPGAKNEELKALLVKTRPAFVAHLEHAKHVQSMLSK
jgi:acyl carrier protein